VTRRSSRPIGSRHRDIGPRDIASLPEDVRILAYRDEMLPGER
jgi:hypothetical protein